MRGKRFSEEQIIGVIKEAETGVAVSELCRKYGLHEGTIYRWRAKYAGMSVSDARRLKSVEDENRRLKGIVADLTLDNQALKAVISKNF